MLDGRGQNLYRQHVALDAARELLSALLNIGTSREEPPMTTHTTSSRPPGPPATRLTGPATAASFPLL